MSLKYAQMSTQSTIAPACVKKARINFLSLTPANIFNKFFLGYKCPQYLNNFFIS